MSTVSTLNFGAFGVFFSAPAFCPAWPGVRPGLAVRGGGGDLSLSLRDISSMDLSRSLERDGRTFLVSTTSGSISSFFLGAVSPRTCWWTSLTTAGLSLPPAPPSLARACASTNCTFSRRGAGAWVLSFHFLSFFGIMTLMSNAQMSQERYFSPGPF